MVLLIVHHHYFCRQKSGNMSRKMIEDTLKDELEQQLGRNVDVLTKGSCMKSVRTCHREPQATRTCGGAGQCDDLHRFCT
jgi:hypothetical protein